MLLPGSEVQGPYRSAGRGCYSTAGCSSSWVVRVSFQPCVALVALPLVYEGGHGRDGVTQEECQEGLPALTHQPSGGCEIRPPDLELFVYQVHVLSEHFHILDLIGGTSQ